MTLSLLENNIFVSKVALSFTVLAIWLLLLSSGAFASNSVQGGAKKRGCIFEKSGASPGKNYRSFLLKPIAGHSSSALQILVDEQGIPSIRAIRKDGLPSSLANVSSENFGRFFAGAKLLKRNEVYKKTLDFSDVNKEFRIDFLFSDGRLKKFRIRKAVYDQRKFNLCDLPKPSIVSLGISKKWFEVPKVSH